ncbi:SPOSA6832_01422 [Sporobolomyces salmonicolor]|uniref:SPOSA6832_01422-mRNA-1:cds n=1 Tax=Sporidiobolus salmonicolor TaxID=5005 RepID=A0A0D6EIM5_SPOSA|nr:SPOSA6832_01422 [Sporobolomyces salmonicolor]
MTLTSFSFPRSGLKMATQRLQLHALAGSDTHDLPSLDPPSLVAASYLQLLHPGDWDLVPCSDPALSPSGSLNPLRCCPRLCRSSPFAPPAGSLPFLKHGPDSFAGSAILHHLLQTSPHAPALSPSQKSDAAAFHALLDTTVLPLVLHSLYSLPQNWIFIRSLLLPHLPFPTSFYRPAQLRESARELVESLHSDWWGLGGEAEKEEELQKRRKKALLETGPEGIRERREEDRREGKERMKKTFGEGKVGTCFSSWQLSDAADRRTAGQIVSAAREVFTSLETTLAASSTPFFFSSSSPTPLDAHLSSLLSLLLFLPLPTPLLADVINASFPRLWAHTALLRRTLWSPDSTPSPRRPASSGHGFSLSTLRDLVPLPWDWESLRHLGLSSASSRVTRGGTPVRQELSKSQRDFARKRAIFLAVCAVGVVGWGVGTGAMPLPGRLGKLLGREFGDDDEEDWDEDEEEEFEEEE